MRRGLPFNAFTFGHPPGTLADKPFQEIISSLSDNLFPFDHMARIEIQTEGAMCQSPSVD